MNIYRKEIAYFKILVLCTRAHLNMVYYYNINTGLGEAGGGEGGFVNYS